MSVMSLTPCNVSLTFAIYHSVWRVCCLSETTSSFSTTGKVSFSAPTLWNHGACFGLFILRSVCVVCIWQCEVHAKHSGLPTVCGGSSVVYFYCSVLSSSLSSEGVGEWCISVPVLQSEKNCASLPELKSYWHGFTGNEQLSVCSILAEAGAVFLKD